MKEIRMGKAPGPRKRAKAAIAPPGQPPRVRPSLQYSVLCDAVQRLPDGSTIFIRPWDTINRLGANPVPVQFAIINCWTSGVGVWNEHVSITDPRGVVLLEIPEQSFWLQSQFNRHNVQHNIQLAPVEPGVYTVRVFLDNQEVLAYRFKVVIHPAPPAAP